MKTAFVAMAACAALAFSAQNVLARGPGGGGGGVGGAANNAIGGGQNAVDGATQNGAQNGNQDGGNNTNGQEHLNANTKNNNNNTNNNNNNRNNNNNGNAGNNNNNNGSNMGRGAFVSRNEHLGDKDFDKHKVGALDESKYKDRHDNNWRYRHWGSEWWYWVPAGYWMYYRNGDWVRYDDSYAYNENENANPNSNFSGPYYEDSNGFYYMQNGRRVYDQQIKRTNG